MSEPTAEPAPDTTPAAAASADVTQTVLSAVQSALQRFRAEVIEPLAAQMSELHTRVFDELLDKPTPSPSSVPYAPYVSPSGPSSGSSTSGTSTVTVLDPATPPAAEPVEPTVVAPSIVPALASGSVFVRFEFSDPAAAQDFLDHPDLPAGGEIVSADGEPLDTKPLAAPAVDGAGGTDEPVQHPEDHGAATRNPPTV